MKSIRNCIAALGLGALALMSAGPARSAQGTGCLPVVGTYSGLQIVQLVNTALAALISSNSGAVAPATACGAVAVSGQLWVDTSANPNALKIYDGASWLTAARWNTSTHVFMPVTGGGTNSLASAATADVCSLADNYVAITGTTTITSLGSSCPTGAWRLLSFSAALTLTHNATSLILPGGTSITTAAGDRLLGVHLGSGNWNVALYTKASGQAVATASTFSGAVAYSGIISPTAIAGTAADWAPTGFSTASRVRASASSASTVTGIAGGSDGRAIYLENVGSNVLTLIPESTASTAANRIMAGRPIRLGPLDGLQLIYDGTSSRWRAQERAALQAVAGGFKNLVITNGATPNSQVAISADQITVEDTNGLGTRLSAFSCTASTASSGAAGIDTGSVAVSTGYHVWAIYNPVTDTASCLLSTSSSAPTMPSGYTMKARVGWNITDSSSVLKRVRQIGAQATYVVTSGTNTAAMVLLSSGSTGNVTSPTWTAFSVAQCVPATARTISVVMTNWTTGGISIAAPNNSYGGYGSSTNAPPLGMWTNSSWPSNTSTQGEWVLESSSIYFAASGAAQLYCKGWTDNLP